MSAFAILRGKLVVNRPPPAQTRLSPLTSMHMCCKQFCANGRVMHPRRNPDKSFFMPGAPLNVGISVGTRTLSTLAAAASTEYNTEHKDLQAPMPDNFSLARGSYQRHMPYNSPENCASATNLRSACRIDFPLLLWFFRHSIVSFFEHPHTNARARFTDLYKYKQTTRHQKYDAESNWYEQ